MVLATGRWWTAFAAQVVFCRDPVTAKGLFLSSVQDDNPVIFLEPKALYRASVGEVPVDDYTIPLGQAEVIREGTDVTVVGWGQQVHILAKVRHTARQACACTRALFTRLCETCTCDANVDRRATWRRRRASAVS